MSDRTIKDDILFTIDDLVDDFLYYDRKEDNILPRGKTQELIKLGVITIDEIIERFRERLSGSL